MGRRHGRRVDRIKSDPNGGKFTTGVIRIVAKECEADLQNYLMPGGPGRRTVSINLDGICVLNLGHHIKDHRRVLPCSYEDGFNRFPDVVH